MNPLLYQAIGHGTAFDAAMMELIVAVHLGRMTPAQAARLYAENSADIQAALDMGDVEVQDQNPWIMVFELVRIDTDLYDSMASAYCEGVNRHCDENIAIFRELAAEHPRVNDTRVE